MTNNIIGFFEDLIKLRDVRSCKKVKSPITAMVVIFTMDPIPATVAIFPSIPETPLFAKDFVGIIPGKKRVFASLIIELFPQKIQ